MARSRTPEDLAGRCFRCWQRLEVCLCSQIPRLGTRTEILVLRHFREALSTSNTARAAALALPRCEIVDYGAEGQPPLERSLLAPGAWVLFPSGDPPSGPPPSQVVVLDGRWGNARRALRRLESTGPLRRVALAPIDPPPPRSRRAPWPGTMSTLEAIALALGLLEGPEVRAALLKLQGQLVGAIGGRRRAVAEAPA